MGIEKETPTITSLMFHDKLCANAYPGQFCMVWIPGVDEIPMSLSTMDPERNASAITVERVGQATKALHRMKVGDTVGIRGPFGNGYSTADLRSVMIVGGGTGLASVTPLAERLAKQRRCKVTFLLGAKTFNDLPFLNRVKKVLSARDCRVIAVTEDGSYGLRGLVTDPAEQLLAEGERFDMVYACGPEQMMHKMFLLTEGSGVPFQASLERLMRCAIGICGTCLVGKYRVCRDGPVFSGKQLGKVRNEFGHFRRGLDGRKATTMT